ncbi:MAG: 50S ribosomal protein L25 [Actinomycetota bacterium]
MADQVALKAATGRELGSSSSRRLRREGKIPAVLYGLSQEPMAIAVEYRDARAALSTDAGLNALLNLEIDGTPELCIVKDLQRHVVRDEVTHIDFLRVDANADVEVEVPLILIGEARAVTNVSGMVDQNLFALNISTKPTSIPNEIEVDVSEMEVGDTIRVDMLELPDGVTAATDAEAAVATAMVTRSTLEAMRQEEEAEAAGEEGEAAGSDGDED